MLEEDAMQQVWVVFGWEGTEAQRPLVFFDEEELNSFLADLDPDYRVQVVHVVAE